MQLPGLFFLFMYHKRGFEALIRAYFLLAGKDGRDGILYDK